jgi:hypothetical protein
VGRESTQPLTEMSTRNFPTGKARSAREADNPNAVCETVVKKMWEPTCLTNLWASTAYYKDSVTFILPPFMRLAFYETWPVTSPLSTQDNTKAEKSWACLASG